MKISAKKSDETKASSHARLRRSRVSETAACVRVSHFTQHPFFCVSRNCSNIKNVSLQLHQINSMDISTCLQTHYDIVAMCRAKESLNTAQGHMRKLELPVQNLHVSVS